MEKIKQAWNWAKNLFFKNKPKQIPIEELELSTPFYSIEHYPLGRSYFGMYGDRYLWINGVTGLVETSKQMPTASKTKEEAIAIIEKHKKQQLQETKITIQYGGYYLADIF